MKRLFPLFLICLMATSVAQVPASHEGHWWMSYSETIGVPLNLTFRDSTPILYSPLQTSAPIRPTTWSYSHDSLQFSHTSTGIKLSLVYHPEDSTFRGTFRQGLLKTEMLFSPTDTLLSFPRPQTPKEPFSFVAKEVKVGRKGMTLSGTLALPTTPMPKGGYPAVVLISGSGQQNRDEELFLHRPFLVWAEYLAQRGIATLRYDDRGVGGSTGDFRNATTHDFADDAEALFRFLRKQPHINPRLVGMMGHSEGGAIAPMVAARNAKVAFVVMLAGQGCTGKEVLLQQNEAIFRQQGLSDSLLLLRLACMDSLFSLPNPTTESVKALLQRQGLTSSQREAIGMTKGFEYQMAQQLSTPWMQAFLRIDPKEYLPQVQCPLLAIGGGRDCQVLSGPNLEAIHKLTVHNPRVETYAPETLNHLMQHCSTGAPSEYLFIEETVAPEVMRRVADFILSL